MQMPIISQYSTFTWCDDNDRMKTSYIYDEYEMGFNELSLFMGGFYAELFEWNVNWKDLRDSTASLFHTAASEEYRCEKYLGEIDLFIKPSLLQRKYIKRSNRSKMYYPSVFIMPRTK